MTEIECQGRQREVRMKAIFINGSPRKHGNTYLIANQVIEGLKSMGIMTKEINLSESTIKYCIGCKNCYKTGECIIQDDVTQIVSEKADRRYLAHAEMKALLSILLSAVCTTLLIPLQMGVLTGLRNHWMSTILHRFSHYLKLLKGFSGMRHESYC